MKRAEQYIALDRVRDTYLRIHKKPVGPKTAERLFSHFVELSQFEDSQALYEAGSAACESALFGTLDSTPVRLERLEAADSCLEKARSLEIKRSIGSASLKQTTPDRTRELRITTAQSRLPIYYDIINYGTPSKKGLVTARDKHIETMTTAANLLSQAKAAEHSGRAGSYIGLCFELLAIGGIDRLTSRRVTITPGFARSDIGYPYPQQTHDLQVIEFSDGNIGAITPLESKATLKVRHSMRYEAGLIGGWSHLLRSGISYEEAVSLLTHEAASTPLSGDEKDQLNMLTEAVIHTVRHYKRSSDYGRHCLNLTKCKIAKTNRVSQNATAA